MQEIAKVHPFLQAPAGLVRGSAGVDSRPAGFRIGTGCAGRRASL